MNILEKKIADALVAEGVTSTDLASLIGELEAAIATADADAEAERAKSLDPLASPDASVAREAWQQAEFARDRLRALLPRLKQRYQQVANQEHYDRWVAEFDRLLRRYDAAVATLKSVYEEFEAKIVAALVEATAVDAEVQRIAACKPYDLPQTNGDGRNLPKVEFAARGITGVGPYGHSILRDMKLPAFADPDRLAWPPPQPSLAVEVATQVAAITRHPGANWWKESEERDRAITEATRERVARQAAERAQRFKEQQERERAADEQRRIERHRALGWPA
jgi:hypothetical protein